MKMLRVLINPVLRKFSGADEKTPEPVRDFSGQVKVRDVTQFMPATLVPRSQPPHQPAKS